MIEVNLTPYREQLRLCLKKKNIIIFGSTISLVAFAWLATFGILSAKTKAVEKETAKTAEKSDVLKKKIGEVEDAKKLKDEIRKKLEALYLLRTMKVGPIGRLTDISKSLKEKIWLTRYSENNENVSLAGVALDEELIAAFMKSLQSTKSFSSVELTVVERADVQGVNAKRFEMTAKIAPSMTQSPAEKGGPGSPLKSVANHNSQLSAASR